MNFVGKRWNKYESFSKILILLGILNILNCIPMIVVDNLRENVCNRTWIFTKSILNELSRSSQNHLCQNVDFFI